jgi:DNA polymerase-3 subunit beta
VKVICVQEKLSKALSVVNRAVATRSSLPVLANVLIATENSMLKLSATNMEISTTVLIGCKTEAEGAITVPARHLTELVTQLAAEPVELTLDSDTLELGISCGSFYSTLKGISADDFPSIPASDDGTVLRIDPGFLKNMIDLTVIACATDDSRPVLSGVCMTIKANDVVFAAADGYRLAVKRLEADTGVESEVQVIVPRSSMIELSRILADTTEEVEIVISPQKTHIAFRIANTEVVSLLVEGQFPNYEQLLPADHQTRIVVRADAMAKASRIAAIFARGGSNVIRVQTGDEDAGPNRIVVSSRSADLGENTGQVDATVEGEDTFIAFNARFLGDCLNILDTEELEILLSGATSPGLLRPLDDHTYAHVIMPMHMVR